MIGQGGSEQIGLTSLKNGSNIQVAFSDDADWISVTQNQSDYFTVTVEKNDTGIARNGIITITQNESGKKLHINVQQQAVAFDDQYEWILHDSELRAEIETFPSRTDGSNLYGKSYFFRGLQDWNPSDPTAVTPSDPCTYEDYSSGRKLNYRSYTVTIVYEGPRNVMAYRTVTVNIWFDPKIKS
jgi:hypothetical protein